MSSTDTHPIIEAHRGDSANAPENTLAAFRRAFDLGVRWTELDIHPAKDGALMVIHDDTLDRTTNGAGAVSDFTAEELRRLDAGSWFDPEFAGERIPLLEEVFELAASRDTRVNVEIKAFAQGFDVADRLVKLLRAFGREKDYLVSSFEVEPLLEVRALAPEISLACIGRGLEILPAARRLGIPWVHAERSTVDAALVAEAHESGIRVNAWVIDDPAELPRWRALGVDKICTNRPAELLPAARGEG